MVLNQQHDRVRGENWDWDCLGRRPGTGWEAAHAASARVGNGVVVGQWATTGTRRMTMTASSSCSTAHSMHIHVRAIQHWFWGGRCRFGCRRGCGCGGVPGLVLGGGYGGHPARGLGHCGRGGGLQCGVLPLFFSFPPASCSHICPLLSTFLNSSPFPHVCMYKVGGG